MKNLFVLFLCLGVLTGCVTTESIYKSYSDDVQVSDGISREEAKIIAKYNLVKMKEKSFYKITGPIIYDDSRTQKYPSYWFVAFGPNWFSPMSKEADDMTYKELNSADYLVVIDKQSGEVKFSGLYYHTRTETLDWVFSSDLSLSNFDLPPGKPGTPAI